MGEVGGGGRDRRLSGSGWKERGAKTETRAAFLQG